MKRALLNCMMVIFIFVLIQVLGGVAGAPFFLLNIDPNTMLGVILIVTNILSVYLVWKILKMINFKTCFNSSGMRLQPSVYALLAAIAGSIVLNLVSEQLDLPNLMEEQMVKLSKNFLGVLGLAIIAPVCEELLFREAIQGHLQRSGIGPWKAILISSFLFGLIHLNPAQIPFAMAMGIILGYIYYKTGNVILTSIAHVVNNSLAVLEILLLGDKAMETSMQDLLGGAQNTIICAVISTVLLVAGFYLFNKTQPSVCSESCQNKEENEGYNREA